MGGAAGLTGFFGALIVFAVLPLLLVLMVGWWAGKRLAYLRLSVMGGLKAVIVLGLIAIIFWTLPIWYAEARHEQPGQGILERLKTLGNIFLWAFVPAIMSASLSWVLNYDDAARQRFLDRAE